MTQEPDIKLLIGALGGAAASGHSAVLIRKQLQSALSGKDGAKISVHLASNAADNLRQEIQRALNVGTPIRVRVQAGIANAVSNATSSSGSQGTTNSVAAAIQRELTEAQQRFQAAERTMAKMRLSAALGYKQENNELAQMNRYYAELERAGIEAAKAGQKVATAMSKCLPLQASFNAYLRGVSPKGLREASTQIESINGMLQAGEYDDAKNAIGDLKAYFKDMGYEGGNAITFIERKIHTFATYLISSKLTTAFASIFRNGVTAVKELDAALTQLKIVTGASDAQMGQFLSKSIDLAKELGRSVTDVLSSIETFSRLGYNLNDASVLSKYSSIMANTAGVDIESANTGITSIIKGYGLKVEDSEHVADVLIKVGQEYAISAAELMEAFEKSGAALNATNTSFEKSAGLLAAANAAVQNASTTGTALKTVSARIRGAKSDLAELGEDTEDLADGFSKYAAELKSLTGFDIMVDANHYKDIYDIFDGISKVWDHLTDTQQARVAEILGGTRQLQVISSIMSNMADATNAYEGAMNSAGTASQANATYMESAAAKGDRMKASFQAMANTILDSGLVGAFYDIGSVIANFLTLGDGFLAKFVGLNIVITTLVSGVKMLAASDWGNTLKGLFAGVVGLPQTLNTLGAASQAFANIAAGASVSTAGLTQSMHNLSTAQLAQLATTNNLNAEQVEAIANAIGLSVAQKQALASALGLTVSETGVITATAGVAAAEGVATTATWSFAAAWDGLKVAIASNPIGFIITGITMLTSFLVPLISSIETAEEKMARLEQEGQELSNTIKTISNDFKTLKDSADDVIPRFAELAKGVNALGENVSLTSGQYGEFIRLNNDIAEMFPALDLGLDSNGNHMLALSYSSDTLTNSLKEQLEIRRQLANLDVASNMSDVFDNTKEQAELLGENYGDLLDLSKNKEEYKFKATYGFDANSIADSNHIRKKNIKKVRQMVGNDVLFNNLMNKYVPTYWHGPDNIGFASEWLNLFASDEWAAVESGLEKRLNDAQMRIKFQWANFSDTLTAWMQTESTYNGFDAGTKYLADRLLSGFDVSAYGFDDADQVKSFVQENILFPLWGAGDEAKAAINNFPSLNELLKNGDISPQDYQDKLSHMFDLLFSDMPKEQADRIKRFAIMAFKDIVPELNGLAWNDNGGLNLVYGVDSLDAAFGLILDGLSRVNAEAAGSDHITKSLKTALAGLSDETTVLRDAMAKLGDSEFMDWLQGADGKWENLKSLLDKFPDLRDELDAYVVAVEAGEDPQKAFTALQQAMNAAIADFNADAIYDGINDVVSACDTYGASSNQVLQAVQNLNRLIPGLVDKLYTEENGHLTVASGANFSAAAIYNAARETIEMEKTAAQAKFDNLVNEFNRIGSAALGAAGTAAIALGQISPAKLMSGDGSAFTKHIDALLASLNSAYDRFQRSENKTGKTSNSSEKVYVPDIDPLYRYLQTVEDINDRLDRIDIDEKLLDEDDFEGKNKLIEERIKKLEELKTALHELNNARDVEIAASVDKLNGYGDFQAAYNAKSGQAIIGNMDALKGLTGDTAKAAEALISNIEDGSKAAISTSNEYMEALAEQNNLLKEQKDLQKSITDDRIERLKNKISLSENQQGVLEDRLHQQGAIHKLKAQIGWLEEIQGIAHEKAEEIRAEYRRAHNGDEMGNDDPLLQDWIEQYWDAADQIKEKRREIADEALAPIDEYIEKADALNWWDNIDVTKVDMLRSKLELIRGMLEDGYLTAAEFKELNDEIAKEIYQEQLDAMNTIIDKTKEMIKLEVEKRIEALESEVDDHQKITDSIKERLDALREENNYNKSVAQKTKEIAELQQKINTLALSNDRRDIAERKKLELELVELQDELADTQADHAYDAQVDALDKSHEAFEQSKQDEIDAVKATIDTEGKLYAAAIERIDKGWDQLYTDLISINDLYQDGIDGEDSITSAWKTAADAAKDYQSILQAIQGVEKENVTNIGNQNLVGQAEVNDPSATSHVLGAKAVDRYGMDVDQQETLANIHAAMKANSIAWHTTNPGRREELHQKNEAMEKEASDLLSLAGHRLVFNPADGAWYIDKIGGERFYDVYHKGGIVGSNEEFAKVEDGELIVPKEHVKPTMMMLEWGNSLASKARGLFSGDKLVPYAMSAAINGTPLANASGAIVNNNAPSFAPNIQVEVKYDSSASPADAKRFGENISAGMIEAFRRKGIGAGATPFLTGI